MSLFEPRAVFITNGGGTTYYPETLLYFYIVGQNVDAGALDTKQARAFKKEFYHTGSNTDHRYCFTIIDLDVDNRLCTALQKKLRRH